MVHLYNSRSAARERFRPRPGQPVGVYVCGITPYDTTHLGHAFLYVVFDVLMRHFEASHGWPVRYVQNVTDIDDDIVRKAAAAGQDWRSLGDHWTDVFRRDLGWLNLRPPERFPGATSAIPRIVSDVARLRDLGLAYESGGSVYFEPSRVPDFAADLGLDYPALLAMANERGNHPDDPHKRDPLDFVLWQAGQPGEPAWSSPWGPGRPGWHIECSTLALEHLGPQVDIHGGGGDLRFPHHACEEAQATPLTTARPWVRWWMHAAMVEMDGQKMSKSLGNLVMVRHLAADGHHPDTIRLYLLRHHYRRPWCWDEARFLETAAWTRTLHAAAARRTPGAKLLDLNRFGPRITGALDDDLDSPTALGAVLELADAILDAPTRFDLAAAQDLLRSTAGRILGLRLQPEPPDMESGGTDWPPPETRPPDLVLPGPEAAGMPAG